MESKKYIYEEEKNSTVMKFIAQLSRENVHYFLTEF